MGQNQSTRGPQGLAHVSTRSPFIFDPLPFGFGGLQRESPPHGSTLAQAHGRRGAGGLGSGTKAQGPPAGDGGLQQGGRLEAGTGSEYALCSTRIFYNNIYIYTHTFVDDLYLKTSGIF